MRELEMLIRSQYNMIPLNAHVGADLELAGSEADDGDAQMLLDD